MTVVSTNCNRQQLITLLYGTLRRRSREEDLVKWGNILQRRKEGITLEEGGVDRCFQGNNNNNNNYFI